MTEEEKIFSDISKILDEVVSLSKWAELLHHDKDDRRGMRIWQHNFQLPKNEIEQYYFVLPTLNSVVSDELISTFGRSKYYIIDCFKQFKSGERVTDPRLFYINFLFNSKGYNDFFEDNSFFRDIDSLYTKRTINFFYDADLLQSKANSNLEKLIDSWQQVGKRALLILGERGIGKSWSVLNYCQSKYKLHRENPWVHPLPIYLNLRGLSENIPGITNLGELIFYHLINQYNIKMFGGYFLFSTLLRQGKIILVFDGLDEMSKEVSDELRIKNIWQLFSVYSNTAKFILTSRINFFNSKMQILEHFAYSEFSRVKSQNPNYKNGLYNTEERRVRQDFNICELTPLNSDERIKLLEKAEKLKDEQLDNGLAKLIKLSNLKNDTVGFELSKLSDTPGYFLPVMKLLASNQFPSLVDVYEQCINRVIIEFNIDTDRAIDKYKTLTKDRTIEGHAFEAEKKNEILRKLSWYMIEREIYEFDIVEFPKFIMDIEDIDFDVVLSDLQTQTVITLREEKKYSFLSESIFSFYVANYLFHSLKNSNKGEVKRGIQNLGKYNFSEGTVLSKAKIFLKAKIETLTQKIDGKINPDKLASYNRILEVAEEVFNKSKPYSPWLKYLSSNLKQIGIEINQTILTDTDFWVVDPISNPENKTDNRMVLIPGDTSVKVNPFFLGVTEITNRDYAEFLESKEYKKLNGAEECFGSYWKRSEVFHRKENNHNNPYMDIINYYHIISWTGDKIPIGKFDHPVVWIAWFAAAKYCNWLSRKENLPLFYDFNLNKDGKFEKVTFNVNACGYRLPTEPEWKFAASEGITNAHTILDLCTDDNEREKKERKYFSESIETTSPVKSENPNKFGVYGLMGNVREWVDNVDRKPLTKFSQQIIKGMGWLLGREGFDFDHISPLISQNNNIDVGFRIARNLTKEEETKVTNAYSKNKIQKS